MWCVVLSHLFLKTPGVSPFTIFMSTDCNNLQGIWTEVQEVFNPWTVRSDMPEGSQQVAYMFAFIPWVLFLGTLRHCGSECNRGADKSS